MNLRVVKLGGSLLSMPELIPKLRGWFHQEPDVDNLVIIGGGEVIEAVRELAAVHSLPQSYWHWKCIELLSLTFDTIAHLVPDWVCLRTEESLFTWIDQTRNQRRTSMDNTLESPNLQKRPKEFHSRSTEFIEWQGPRSQGSMVANVALVSVASFYYAEDSNPLSSGLPHSWDTTTDSLAALLARKVGASKLTLLKSCDIDPGVSVAEASRCGFVDPAFEFIAHGIEHIEFVNFRRDLTE